MVNGASSTSGVIGRSVKACVLGALLIVHLADCRYAARDGQPRVAQMIQESLPAVVSVRAIGELAQEAASGFIVRGRDDAAFVVTNYHVIWGADEIFVETSCGVVGRADVLGVDPATDLAVLRPRSRLPPGPHLVFGDDRSVGVGDWVAAIGNPGGVAGAVSMGVISARGKVPRPTVAAQACVDYLFTDTAVAAGSSGGPLLALDGRVVGVNVATVGQSGGLAIVIPAGLASRIVAGIESGGVFHHSSAGIRVVDDERSALVRVASCDGECRGSEVEVGDKIVTINGERVRDARELERRAFMTEPGTQWKVELLREGKPRSAVVALRKLTEEDFVERLH